MDQSITTVIGAVIFGAFVIGLAESIGAIPFFVIVGIVVLLMAIDSVETIRDALKIGDSNDSSE